jgi:hypothetical protein
MPLDSPEGYIWLDEHLRAIDDAFQHFLRESGYSDNTGALGRYPHRSAVLRGRICRKIDLEMDLGSDGLRFEVFFPDIPYTLWAGAWLDEGGIRYSAPRPSAGDFFVFERLPFSTVTGIIGESLSQAARRLAEVTEASLKESGIQTKLAGS